MQINISVFYFAQGNNPVLGKSRIFYLAAFREISLPDLLQEKAHCLMTVSLCIHSMMNPCFQKNRTFRAESRLKLPQLLNPSFAGHIHPGERFGNGFYFSLTSLPVMCSMVMAVSWT